METHKSGQLLNGAYSQTLLLHIILLHIILFRVLVYLGSSLLHSALLVHVVSASMIFVSMLHDSVPCVTQLTFWFFSYMFIRTRCRVVWGRHREGACSSCWQKAERCGVRGQNQSIMTRGQPIPFSVRSETYTYAYYGSRLKEAAE